MADTDTLETFRSLRETIKHAEGGDPIRSVLVVDVDRKAPSRVAERLADAFFLAGDRCAFIDANFRAAGSGEMGLADLVRDPEATIEFKDGEGPTFVGAGNGADPDLLSSKTFPGALGGIIEQFDYAVVTCDRFPASSDAIALGPLVDAVILVISAGVTDRGAAIQARDSLERVGARILGMVMVERPRRWF